MSASDRANVARSRRQRLRQLAWLRVVASRLVERGGGGGHDGSPPFFSTHFQTAPLFPTYPRSIREPFGALSHVAAAYGRVFDRITTFRPITMRKSASQPLGPSASFTTRPHSLPSPEPASRPGRRRTGRGRLRASYARAS